MDDLILRVILLDVEKLGKDLPLPCCNMTIGECDAKTAESVGVKGCRSKVELIATLKSAILLHVSIATIFMQVSSQSIIRTDGGV